MNKKLKWGLVVGIVMAGLCLWFSPWLHSSQDKAVTVVSPTIGTIQSSVIVPGELVPLNRMRIDTPVRVRILKIHAMKGAHVRRGQCLFTLENLTYDELRQADQEATLSTTEMALKKKQLVQVHKTYRQAVDNTTIELQLAKKQRDLYKELYQAKAVPKSKVEEMELLCRKATAQLEQAKADLMVPAAELQFKKDQGKLEELQEKIQTVKKKVPGQSRILTILAPEDGILLDIPSPEGNLLEANMPLAELALDGASLVKAKVPEYNINQIAINAPVEISSDLFSETLSGNIENIGALADASAGVRVYDVSVRLNGNTETMLRCNGSVTAKIITAEKEAGLLLPLSVVVRQDGRTRVFFLTKDNHVQEKEVQVGLSNENQVEILSGVRLHDRLIREGTLDLKPGEKVMVCH